MATDLRAKLQELAAYEYTQEPFVSIYLDWRPDGNSKRSAILVLEQELRAINDRIPAHGTGRASFDADQQRIMEYVRHDAPDEAHGLAIFACDGEGVWETLPFLVPLETHIAEDRYPHIFGLAQVIDDHETYAVALADGQDSRIMVVSLESAERVAEAGASEPIKRFDQGGTAQMLFQRRTDNLIKAHTKDLAAELEKAIHRHKVRHIVITCNDSIKGIVTANLTPAIQDRLIDIINLDKLSNLPAIIEAVDPLVREAERIQEVGDIAALEDQLASKGGLAVAGPGSTALALSKGQVHTLLLLDQFSGPGGQCEHCGMLIAGDWTICPYDNKKLLPVNLREAFVARAIRQNADIQFVEASPVLDEHGGVAALLRYRDDTPEAEG